MNKWLRYLTSTVILEHFFHNCNLQTKFPNPKWKHHKWMSGGVKMHSRTMIFRKRIQLWIFFFLTIMTCTRVSVCTRCNIVYFVKCYNYHRFCFPFILVIYLKTREFDLPSIYISGLDEKLWHTRWNGCSSPTAYMFTHGQ